MSDEIESRPEPPKERPRRSFWRRHTGLLLVVAVLVLAGAGAGAWALTSKSPSKPASPTHGFAVTHPSDWKAVSLSSASAESAPGAGKEVAAFEQTAGKGTVVIRVGGKSAPLGASFVKSFESNLHKQIPDAKLTKAGFLRLANNKNALFIAYEQAKKGTLTTITLVPAGSLTYVIDTVCGTAAVQTAKEIGTIIRSFTWH